MKKAIEGYNRLEGPDRHDSMKARIVFAQIQFDQGQKHLAEKEARAVLDQSNDHAKSKCKSCTVPCFAQETLAWMYCRQSKYEESEEMFKQALAGYERVHGPKHTRTLSVLEAFGASCKKQGRLGEAEVLLKRALTSFEEIAKIDDIPKDKERDETPTDKKKRCEDAWSGEAGRSAQDNAVAPPAYDSVPKS